MSRWIQKRLLNGHFQKFTFFFLGLLSAVQNDKLMITVGLVWQRPSCLLNAVLRPKKLNLVKAPIDNAWDKAEKLTPDLMKFEVRLILTIYLYIRLSYNFAFLICRPFERPLRLAPTIQPCLLAITCGAAVIDWPRDCHWCVWKRQKDTIIQMRR